MKSGATTTPTKERRRGIKERLRQREQEEAPLVPSEDVEEAYETI